MFAELAILIIMLARFLALLFVPVPEGHQSHVLSCRKLPVHILIIRILNVGILAIVSWWVSLHQLSYSIVGNVTYLIL